MTYKIVCNECDHKVFAKNKIEAEHFQKKHISNTHHLDIVIERIS